MFLPYSNGELYLRRFETEVLIVVEVISGATTNIQHL